MVDGYRLMVNAVYWLMGKELILNVGWSFQQRIVAYIYTTICNHLLKTKRIYTPLQTVLSFEGSSVAQTERFVTLFFLQNLLDHNRNTQNVPITKKTTLVAVFHIV